MDIILAGVEDHEMGSASSVPQSANQLDMSLGVAVTILLPRYARRQDGGAA